VKADDFRTRHRGPYRYLVIRPSSGKAPWRGEWLRGQVDADDVEHEARALLADPRDAVRAVHVWSVREEQFVMTYAAPPADGLTLATPGLAEAP
jgi:hypothetical protein